MRIKKSVDEAIKWARGKAQESGIDYRVVEVGGVVWVGTFKKILFHFPKAEGYNVCYIY